MPVCAGAVRSDMQVCTSEGQQLVMVDFVLSPWRMYDSIAPYAGEALLASTLSIHTVKSHMGREYSLPEEATRGNIPPIWYQ